MQDLVSASAVGNGFLILALFGRLVQLTARGAAQRVAASAAAAAGLCAFGALAYGFAVSDYRLLTVFEHSANLTPVLYKITATWGNHEGSLLLLLALLGLYAARLAYDGIHPELKTLSLRAMAGVGIAFELYILFASNPFVTQAIAPADGSGFNPLLQDIGLAAHPPILYTGYIGLAVPFALALAGLWRGRLDGEWAEAVRRHTLFAWAPLTCGIALGAWWAYRELGWGGFWFWDPVENASFMPWLAATAALHSAALSRKTGRCAPWTAALALVAFWLVTAGFFLVRSGIVTSVHAFASAPGRGISILAMLFFAALAGVVAFLVWAKRAPDDAPSAPLNAGGLSVVAQTLWMCVAMATVLIATLYPLLVEALAGHKISVGAPYFNGVFRFLIAPLIIGTALLPALCDGKRPRVHAIAFVIAAVSCAALLCFSSSPPPAFFIALFSLAAGGLGAEAGAIWRGIWAVSMPPPRFFRMHAAHSGAFILLCGIFLAAFLQQEDEFVVTPGERAAVAGYEAAFEKMERVRGENYLALRGIFTAYDGMHALGELSAEARFYPQEGMQTAESSIVRLPGADLYLSMGEAMPTGEAGIRLQYKPGVPLIWLGAAIMALAALTGIRQQKDKGDAS